MTLYSLFHPVVVYVTAARVDAAAGKPLDGGAFYSHIMRELETVRKKGMSLAELAPAVETACAYTAFYVDYMVHEGPFSFSAQWQDLGRNKYHELAGDEKFFDYMQQFLEEDTPLATDHLRLMHAMVNSGFAGAYQHHAVELESLLRRVSARIRIETEGAAAAKLLHGAGTPLHSVNAVHPVHLGVIAVLVGAGLLLMSTGCYLYMYRHATDALRTTLNATRDLVLEDAYLHAHNSDSLVVSQYPADAAHPAEEEEAEPSAPAAAPAEEPQPAVQPAPQPEPGPEPQDETQPEQQAEAQPESHTDDSPATPAQDPENLLHPLPAEAQETPQQP